MSTRDSSSDERPTGEALQVSLSVNGAAYRTAESSRTDVGSNERITVSETGLSLRAKERPILRGISEVASEIMPVTEEEFESISVGAQQSKTSFQDNVYISRLIQHLASTSAKSVTASDVSQLVESLIDSIHDNLSEKFRGKRYSCGSFYEGVKIDVPNEFDYIFEMASVNGNALQYEQVLPETFKPRKNETIRPRSYFKLRFAEVPEIWRCRKCEGCIQEEPCMHTYLDPRKTQQDFRADVTRAIALSCGKADITDMAIKCSGPAVTIYMKLSKEAIERYLHDTLKDRNKKTTRFGKRALHKPKEQHLFTIKIDITLAIPLVNEHPERDWFPLYGLSLKPTHLADSVLPIQKCHLVTSGDFWKASFSLTERDEVQKQIKCQGRKDCFQVLKHLRDKLSITDEQDAEVLGTYPIKVAFLKECQDHESGADWNFWKGGSRAMNILQRIEQQGKQGKLTSYVIKDEPILMESDRCYLESRRIQEYLRDENEGYSCHGRVHSVLLTLYWVLSLLVLLFSIRYLIAYNNSDLPAVGSCKIRIDPGVKLELGNYLLQVIGLTSIQLMLPMVGLMFVAGYKCSWSRGLLYDVYRSVLVTYVVLLLGSLAFFVSALWLAAGYKNLFDKCITMYQVKALTVTNIVLASIVVIAGLIHVITVSALMRCRIYKYRWEWAFPDQLWSEWAKKCARRWNGNVGGNAGFDTLES